jgi:putative oxidoreductase
MEPVAGIREIHMQTLDSVLPRVGRALVGALFVTAGIVKAANFVATAGEMTASGMPLASLLLAGAIGMEVIGGAALILGLRPRIAALALALFLIPVTVLFHPFWVGDAATSEANLWHFLKNVAVLGAMLLIVARPATGSVPGRTAA